MSKAEKYIEEHTSNCSNIAHCEDSSGNEWEDIFPWLTPEQAKRAVEIAGKEVIEKAIRWIGEIYNYHEIMRYSDNHEPSLEELTEWFKNYMKGGGKDE